MSKTKVKTDELSTLILKLNSEAAISKPTVSTPSFFEEKTADAAGKRAMDSKADYSLFPSRALRDTPTDTLLPVGEGAYQSAKAVEQRTTDPRKICEEAKAKGDYSDKLWTECFKTGGDYTYVRSWTRRTCGLTYMSNMCDLCGTSRCNTESIVPAAVGSGSQLGS